MVRVRFTSRRTGRVGWYRLDGTPSSNEGDAGRFTRERAEELAAEHEQQLIAAIGRFPYAIEFVE